MKYQVMLMSQTSVNTIMVQKSLKTIHSTHQNQYASFLILRSSFFHFLVPNFLQNIAIAITHIFKELLFNKHKVHKSPSVPSQVLFFLTQPHVRYNICMAV